MNNLGIALTILAISLANFASTGRGSCDGNHVINIIPDAHHPFWGSSIVATYGYITPDGCVYVVSYAKKYRFWISVGTEAVQSHVPIYCN